MLVNVGVEMLGEGDDVIPSAVFFNLGAYDESRVATGIERADHFVEGCGIRLNDLRDFAQRSGFGIRESSRPWEWK